MTDRELLEALYNDMQTLKQKVTGLEMMLENETNHNIQLLILKKLKLIFDYPFISSYMPV